MENTMQEIHEQIKQQVAGTFSRSAATYDRVGPHFFTRFGERLVELAGITRGERILDVATGRGASLFSTAEIVGADGQVVGVDLAEQMVEETGAEIGRQGIKNAEVRRMDAEQLEFPDTSFDGVLCGFALFFLPHLPQALTEMYRVLRPSGRLAVSTWGADDQAWNWLEDLFKTYMPQMSGIAQTRSPFYQLNDEARMRNVLQQAGFEQIRVVEEAQEVVFADEEEWWAVQWSHGMRWLLEQLPQDALLRFKAEAFEKIQPLKRTDGIPQVYTALFTLAVRPA